MNLLITGASRGIGRSVALRFAPHAKTMFLCARHAESLQTLSDELLAAKPGLIVHFMTADMSKAEEIHALSEWLTSHTDALDILVNNAGVFLPGSVLEEADGTLETLLDTNVMSAYRLTRNVIPLIRNSAKGHIFNMCSIASFTPYANGGSYAISKFALLGFSKVLREELKTEGIRVTSIMPGATWTDSWSDSGIAPERMMASEDIAEMIWAAYSLSSRAVVEDLILRPQLGDL
ncbi:MAG: SDR family oxidoreductase [Saprospiraceae bacterium]|nr:SDR family oxidoreductase [Saprospiraceae bacterium]